MAQIRQGLRRHRYKMEELLLGEKKITKVLVEKMKGMEALEEEREKRRLVKYEKKPEKRREARATIQCFKCNQTGHYANECPKTKVNQVSVESLREINKSDSIYVSGVSIIPVIDSGAADSYITAPLVVKLKLEMETLLDPLTRYTCLGERFYIRNKVRLEFQFQGITYREEVYVFPKREDEAILLGQKWIDKVLARTKLRQGSQKGNKEINMLEKLFEGRKEGITLPYEGRIETKPGERIVESATKIPQALEKKVWETTQDLLDKGFIRPSNSGWCHKIQ